MADPIPLSFTGAQNFFVDSQLVGGAAEVQVSRIDLYVKSKPLIPDFNIDPGIIKPGILLFIAPTLFGVPNIDFTLTPDFARVEYDEIQSSSDASVLTKFRFDKPQTIKTDTEYTFVVKIDNNANYVLWKSKQGEYLVGTTTVSSGLSGTDVGLYYEFSSGVMDPSTARNNWRPLSDTQLKFKVYCSRYYVDTVPVEDTELTVNTELITPRPRGTFVDYVDGSFIIPSAKMEFMTYDQDTSIRDIFVGGQMAFQNTVFYPGGKTFHNVATYSNNLVVAAATLPNGSAFSWSSIFPGQENRWLVLFDTDTVNIRQVATIISNTELEVVEPVSFTNATANFMITPVAQISQFNKSSPYGVSESILLLTNSTANSTVHFVNNCIEFITPTVGGSGYSNNDIIYVNGFENITTQKEGGYAAIAYPTTNSTGGITSIAIANLGCGFVNTQLITATVANSTSSNTTSNTSAGSGASFSYSVGATIKTELRTTNIFRNVNVMNMPISDVLPFFDITNPTGASYDLKLETRYVQKPSNTTSSGYVYYVTTPNTSIIQLDMYKRTPITIDNTAVFMSRSNEFNTKYANGAPNDQINDNFSNSIVMTINCHSNNDYVAISVNSLPFASFAKYLINNDYTGEEGDRGAAWAKGLTTRINFGRPSDDIFVYLTAYRPASTEIEVYARIHNSHDPEAFDDKDWTRLEHKDLQTIYSSSSDTNDFIELKYTFGQHPNVEYTVAGVATIANNTSNVVGVGTTFTSNLAVNDLIRIYPVLFPNTNILAVVKSISNNTLLTINTNVTNNEFLGQTLAIDKIEFKHQAFNNIMNDNVVRYYNSSMIEFDGYNRLQIKTVLLSSHPNRIPRVDDIRLAGTSA